MKIDLDFYNEKTKISFKLKDITNLSDIIEIVFSLASGRHSFEANSLFTTEFKQFIGSLQPRKTYEIVVGHDNYDRPFVRWGSLPSPPLKSVQKRT
jgi:chitinase